ncbi:hypothetical protein JS561_20025 [Salmonella enterica subsp. enterica serovar Infantis]|nr:hypothetical protein JS561_20025 [Salmonella enterica subsp. enterica serovar Infantis]
MPKLVEQVALNAGRSRTATRFVCICARRSGTSIPAARSKAGASAQRSDGNDG